MLYLSEAILPNVNDLVFRKLHSGVGSVCWGDRPRAVSCWTVAVHSSSCHKHHTMILALHHQVISVIHLLDAMTVRVCVM